MKRHVDLCSGIGGFALGFEWAQLSSPILFCDTDDWCRRVLRKHWSDVPIAEDVKELANDPTRLVPDCDILTAGYPCQPFSVAGKQRGAEDDRHIWPEIRTIVEAKRPTWCVFENVYGHIKLGLDEVLSDLEAIGYATRPFVVPACAVNAPHKRNRVWIIAHADSEGESGRAIDEGQRSGKLVGNAQHNGSPTTKINGSSDQASDDSAQRKEATRKPTRTGGRGDSSDVAYTDSDDGRHRSGTKSQERQARVEHGRGGERQLVGRPSENVAYTNGTGSQGQWGQHRLPEDQREEQASWIRWWQFEPPVGRVADGIPRRVDRIRGLGNAIVPAIAQQIGIAIKENYDAN
jgi:DNA (cytosine-5)-methyltransferase 1